MHYTTDNDGNLVLSGEHKLLANILHRALEDAYGKQTHPDIRNSALSWIFAEDEDHFDAVGFDFQSTCEYLRVDPGWVRKLVKSNQFTLSSHNFVREVLSRKGTKSGSL